MEKYIPGKKCIVMTREQVRAFDRHAITVLGIPGVVLMENAGRSCAELIREKLENVAAPRVCVFCGGGNNGGDGYVIARHLLNSGFALNVVLCADPARVKGDAAVNLNILRHLGQPVRQLAPAYEDPQLSVDNLVGKADMIVDALFGTGLEGTLRDEYVNLIESINRRNCPVMAVDIPSGLDCDTGEPLGAAIRADFTVTFVAVKKGFVENPAAAGYTGDVFVASIGVQPRAGFEKGQ